ncbi:uncharacterized protein N7482_006430 [Penicillium canariense]|uniref:C2H2-type domain-containing protein n=1 Tax=Penicillium canariense TaxID=189055 RepID=A0A9W9HXJ1_9EURO|nr:uncharacterized protein N7482_006430 [Penicillium canariense]KAJ5159426.1 hypothetical protein N7482_006430 [Penicillium canariense]
MADEGFDPEWMPNAFPVLWGEDNCVQGSGNDAGQGLYPDQDPTFPDAEQIAHAAYAAHVQFQETRSIDTWNTEETQSHGANAQQQQHRKQQQSHYRDSHDQDIWHQPEPRHQQQLQDDRLQPPSQQGQIRDVPDLPQYVRLSDINASASYYQFNTGRAFNLLTSPAFSHSRVPTQRPASRPIPTQSPRKTSQGPFAAQSHMPPTRPPQRPYTSLPGRSEGNQSSSLGRPRTQLPASIQNAQRKSAAVTTQQEVPQTEPEIPAEAFTRSQTLPEQSEAPSPFQDDAGLYRTASPKRRPYMSASRSTLGLRPVPTSNALQTPVLAPTPTRPTKFPAVSHSHPAPRLTVDSPTPESIPRSAPGSLLTFIHGLTPGSKSNPRSLTTSTSVRSTIVPSLPYAAPQTLKASVTSQSTSLPPTAKRRKLDNGSRPPVPPSTKTMNWAAYARDSPSRKHITYRQDIVEPIDLHGAAAKDNYDPATIARDVLIVAGKHPTEKGLNNHLQILRQNFIAVDNSSDLATFRWDIVDPDVQTQTRGPFPLQNSDYQASSMGSTVGHEEPSPPESSGLAGCAVSHPTRDTPTAPPARPAESHPGGNGVNIANNGSSYPDFQLPRPAPTISPSSGVSLNSLGSLPFKPVPSYSPYRPPPQPLPSSLPPRAPQPSCQTVPAQAPFPALESAAEPTITVHAAATTTTSASSPVRSFSKTPQVPSQSPRCKAPQQSPLKGSPQTQVVIPPSPHSMAPKRKPGRPPRKDESQKIEIAVSNRPVTQYQVFQCKWAKCEAELHNLQAIHTHVLKVHIPHHIACGWGDCADKTPRAAADMWDHIRQKHMAPLAWALGDGPAVSGTAAGDYGLPGVSSQNAPHDAMTLPADRDTVKIYSRIHGTQSTKQKAQLMENGGRRWKEEAGPDSDTSDRRISTPARLLASSHEETAYTLPQGEVVI